LIVNRMAGASGGVKRNRLVVYCYTVDTRENLINLSAKSDWVVCGCLWLEDTFMGIPSRRDANYSLALKVEALDSWVVIAGMPFMAGANCTYVMVAWWL